MKKIIFLFLFISGFSQTKGTVDFKSVHADLKLNPVEKSVSGTVIYDFEIKKTVDTIFIDAKSMTFLNIKINGITVKSINTSKKLLLFEGYKKGKNQLTFDYKATPKQALYFVGFNTKIDSGQIWTQGQGKYTSNWFPSFDDVNEKLIFNLSITFNSDFKVISNGILYETTHLDSNQTTWHYKMENPMPSYLLSIVVGKFDYENETSKLGIPLENYFLSNDKSKYATTYKHSTEIFDFFEEEIGVSYPWQIYRQVPVRDFLYAGMENTSATTFSQEFLVDSIGFNDRNYININAHELAHQWFGNFITAKSGKDHWLQEGFATYYALLAEQKLFGDDHFNWKLYQSAVQLDQNSKNDTIPILSDKASSLTYYQKGAWAIHYLKSTVGNESFKKIISNYLNKYKFKNVGTDDFLYEVKKVVSTFDTNKFKEIWLKKFGFETQTAVEILRKNSFMHQYFEVVKMRELPFNEKTAIFNKIIDSTIHYPLKEEVVNQLTEVSFAEKADLIKKIMYQGELHSRQALVETLATIPDYFKEEYESFLDDASYMTQEMAMRKLWDKFPNNRNDLLDKTSKMTGFSSKNLRILWLSLALKTKNYQRDNKVLYYQELLDYSAPIHDSEIRKNALETLLNYDINDKNYWGNLINILTSHQWQIVKFGREKIRFLLKNPKNRTFFEKQILTLPEADKIQLEKLLKEK
jgi:aminopeptidase N